MRIAHWLCALAAGVTLAPAATYQPTAEERRQIESKIADLDAALRPLRAKAPDDLVVDVEVYLKAAQWIVRFDEFYTKAYVGQTLTVLDNGLARARELAAGNPAWSKRTGTFGRAYRSRIDGSVQPYAITVPANYSGQSPQWLEVILHGRGTTLNEVSFLFAHDRAKPVAADHDFIRLDVFGRVNNAYRWAGETDVFEAIESVKRRYKIDDTRIVLRGFSMGGAGAWHLGLHYPDRWAAVEAGAGFIDTKVYAKIENPPPYVHIYDAIDYALNAVMVPMVGYAGEDDPQLRSSTTLRKELEREKYSFVQDGMNWSSDDPKMLFLVGPKTPHRWHPESKKRSDAFLLQAQSAGVIERPKLRFVTYTERYNRCFWVTVDQLEQQYERAQVEAAQEDFTLALTTRNVARLTVRGERPFSKVSVDGKLFASAPPLTLERVAGAWRVAKSDTALRKRQGLQGPIDDAFMEAFLCVTPSSKQTSDVNDYAQSVFRRLKAEFPKWMRGDIRSKTSAEVNAADTRDNNIIAFGTPSTNPVIARAMASLPVRWTRESIVVGTRKFDAAAHMLSVIYPNPANPKRYIVVNSGHTFHEAEFKGTNALLYPRAGDWAVTDIKTGAVVAEGVFDKNWRLPAN